MPTLTNNNQSPEAADFNETARTFGQSFVNFTENTNLLRSRTFDFPKNVQDRVIELYAKSKINPRILSSQQSQDLRDDIIALYGEFWGSSPILITPQMKNKARQVENQIILEDLGITTAPQIIGAPKKKKLPKKKQQKKQKKERKRRQKIRRMKLKAVAPVKIPYNVDDNIPLNDGGCVSEYINKYLYNRCGKKENYIYDGETVNDLINYCEEQKINYKLYYIVNGYTIAENTFNNKKGINAICYNEHLYPLAKGQRTLKLNSGKQDLPDYNNKWMNYFLDGKKIENGVIPKELILSDDIKFHKIETKKGYFDFDTDEILRKGIQAFQYKECGTHYVIDKNDAYYDFSVNQKTIGLPNIADTFKAGSPTEINPNSYYILDRAYFPYLTNVLRGDELVLLQELNKLTNESIPVITYYLDFKTIINFPDITPYKNDKKAFRIQNGLWGETNIHSNEEIYFESLSEARRTIDDIQIGELDEEAKCIVINKKIIRKILNERYLHYSVKSNCNREILKLILNNFKEHNILPRYVCTDAIGYDTKLPIPNGYKKETDENSLTKTVVNPFTMTRKIKYKETNYANTTIIGPAGTAKSRRIAEEYKYDLSCTNDNDLASRSDEQYQTGMKTIFKLFNLFPSSNKPDFALTKDKTIWSDEISKNSAFIWAIFQQAYHHNNTRFLLTGDFEQLTAFYDYADMKNHKFLGKIIELNDQEHQERSSKEIIKLGEQVLDGSIKIKPDNQKNKLSLCFTNRKRHEINEEMLKYYNKKWGDIGIQVKCISSKIKQFVKGRIYTYDGSWQLGEQGKNWELAYAITAFSSQGFTIDDHISIYESERMLQINPKHLWTIIRRCRNVNQLHFQK